MYVGELSDAFLFWLEATVYNGQWVLDGDLLEYLLGDGQ